MTINLQLAIVLAVLLALVVLLWFGWSALVVTSRADDWMERQMEQAKAAEKVSHED